MCAIYDYLREVILKLCYKLKITCSIFIYIIISIYMSRFEIGTYTKLLCQNQDYIRHIYTKHMLFIRNKYLRLCEIQPIICQ